MLSWVADRSKRTFPDLPSWIETPDQAGEREELAFPLVNRHPSQFRAPFSSPKKVIYPGDIRVLTVSGKQTDQIVELSELSHWHD